MGVVGLLGRRGVLGSALPEELVGQQAQGQQQLELLRASVAQRALAGPVFLA